MGDNFVAVVRKILLSLTLLRQAHSTIMSLVPNKIEAERLSNFRLVSFCNIVYKVIYRILNSCLKSFLPYVVQRNQVRFVKRRLLCENILMASELVLDFDKVCRTFQWLFADGLYKGLKQLGVVFFINILEAFELPPIFIQWIIVYISSPYYLVSFNGELVGFFLGKESS